jgi:hypothetical protein
VAYKDLSLLPLVALLSDKNRSKGREREKIKKERTSTKEKQSTKTRFLYTDMKEIMTRHIRFINIQLSSKMET